MLWSAVCGQIPELCRPISDLSGFIRSMQQKEVKELEMWGLEKPFTIIMAAVEEVRRAGGGVNSPVNAAAEI